MVSDGLRDRLKDLLLPSGGLVERTIKSSVWAGLINVSDRILRFGKLVILASLLAPSDFGLFGIAMLAIAALRQFSRLGFDTALIQNKQKDVDKYLNTAWTIKLFRGVLIATIAFFAAPLVASFFSEPRAVPILRAVSIVPLFEALANPGVIYFRKNLKFHREFTYRMSGAVVDVSVAIAAAVILQSVWALVFGRIAGRAASGVVSYAVHEYRPRFGFQREAAAELVDYGKWIFGTEILVFLTLQGDDIFVGWFLGATALGFYQLAYRISNTPTTEVAHVISSVTIPMYSKIQSDFDKLRRGYYRTLQITSTISLPMATGIIVVAPNFVHSFLGEKWIPIIPLIQILAIWGAVRSIEAVNGALFKSIDKPHTETKLQFLRFVLIAATIYPLTTAYGVVGAAIALVVSGILETPVSTYLVTRTLSLSIYGWIKTIGIPLLSSIVMFLIVEITSQRLLLSQGILKLGFLMVLGTAVYCAILFILDWWFEYGLRDLLRNIAKGEY